MSLSTVTAAAVAAPLALKAVSVDANPDPAAPIGGIGVPSTTPESPTTIDLPGIVDAESDGRGKIVPVPSVESTTTSLDDGPTRPPSTTAPVRPPTTAPTTTEQTTTTSSSTTDTTVDTSSSTTESTTTDSTGTSVTSSTSVPETTVPVTTPPAT